MCIIDVSVLVVLIAIIVIIYHLASAKRLWRKTAYTYKELYETQHEENTRLLKLLNKEK